MSFLELLKNSEDSYRLIWKYYLSEENTEKETFKEDYKDHYYSRTHRRKPPAQYRVNRAKKFHNLNK